jgi:hypothetical protein
MPHKSVTIRLEDDFHDEVGIALIRRKVPSLKDLVTRLLEAWLEDPDLGMDKKT